MLTKKQLEATTSLSEYSPEKELAQTALLYREMLVKVLQVMEGFDYRANINFTMTDCLDVEIEAKALLKEVEE